MLKIREELFLEVLKKVIKEIEEEALQGARQCKKCGSPLVRNGQEPRKIRTLIGEVELERVRLCCKRWGEELYPLDKAMGLSPRERVTLEGKGEGSLGSCGGQLF